MTKHDSVRAGRVIDAHLHLLDRQVLDKSRTPVTAVDDLELTDVAWNEPLTPNTEAPTIVDLLSGPVLGTRIFGGRPPRSRWHRIAWTHVTELATAIRLDVAGEELDVSWVERWMRDHVIRRIPGGSHDPE
jgi:hypothetical protein